MQKTDEILLTIAVIVLLLTVILTVLLWQIRHSREKMRNREALTEQLTRENAEMIERLKQKGIAIPETIKTGVEI